MSTVPNQVRNILTGGLYSLRNDKQDILKQKAHACNLKLFLSASEPSTSSPRHRFTPPSVDWQKQACSELGFKFVKKSFGNTKASKQVCRDPHQRYKISGDGNCLFRALVYCVTGSQDEHGMMRTIICDELEKAEMQDGEAGAAYVQRMNMREDGTWGTTDEIFAAARIVKVTVCVFSICGNSSGWQRQGEGSPSLYIDNSSGNHFDVVLSTK
jgi:hypothetical protein